MLKVKNMTERFVMFDIGANWGTDSLQQTKVNSNYETWAFEPTPILIDHLKKESSPFSFNKLLFLFKSSI